MPSNGSGADRKFSKVYHWRNPLKVKLDHLRQTCVNALLNYGFSEDEALIIQDVLMYAQLRGNNQGIVKLVGPGLPKDPKAGPISIKKETSISALLDGGRNLGMLAMMRAMEMAARKAKEHGIGIVGTNNTFSSTGAIGYYARRIADVYEL